MTEMADQVGHDVEMIAMTRKEAGHDVEMIAMTRPTVIAGLTGNLKRPGKKEEGERIIFPGGI